MSFRSAAAASAGTVVSALSYGWSASATAGTNTTALINAIGAVPSLGGIVSLCPAGIYEINAGVLGPTLTDRQGLSLFGCGADLLLYHPHPSYGTVLKATGGSGVMIDWAAATTTDSLVGNAIDGISLDCNGVASTGLRLASHYGFQCPAIAIYGATTIGMVWTTVNLAGVEDFQGARFGQVYINSSATAAAKAWTWGSVVAGGGNVGLCKVDNVILYTTDGTGLEIGDADHNLIDFIECNRAGTATGVDFLATNSVSGSGHARFNRILMVDGPGPVVARATGFSQASGPNYVGIGVGGNSQPWPTIEQGAELVVEDLAAL